MLNFGILTFRLDLVLAEIFGMLLAARLQVRLPWSSFSGTQCIFTEASELQCRVTDIPLCAGKIMLFGTSDKSLYSNVYFGSINDGCNQILIPGSEHSST